MQINDHCLRQLDTKNEWFGINADFSERPILEHTGHRYMPDRETTEQIWRRCPQNPWEARQRQDLSPMACQVAMKHRGSLVFNTTTAALTLRPDAGSSGDLETTSLQFIHLSKSGLETYK